ncbi:MAG: hypothetical protein OM95_03855 [Bdellovibrio sp. ArHS]|uniref:beta-sandwich domain-containing protein n=1 Tax=Bdellovibrio sp. ArHS TaxID=1569284 RepID=UPI000583F286|nr:beta-sandwich domain-containing protein [Bdellovibrio sp. ArHS]KHD89497.1 MAG: hypothetical protein OM95_03855 [Bdellovibrio sp. ArHS]
MKAFTKALMAVSLMTSHLAQASGIEDLPSFEEETVVNQTPAPVVASETPVTAAPVANLLAGSVSINSISRKSNGTIYTVDLRQALSLVRVDLRVTAQKLKVHGMTLITDTGLRVDVKSLKNSAVLEAGAVVSSESLNQSDRVAAIEVVAESYGAEANMLLTAIADRDVPVMKLRSIAAPIQPSRPVPPPPPVTPPKAEESRPQPYQPSESDYIISTGDRVYYNNSVGVVLGVYSNGKVNLKREGYYDTTVSLDQLAKSVRCTSKGRICVKDVVLVSGGMGKAKEVFTNGKVLVVREGYYDSFVDADSIGKEVDCLGSICKGSNVIYSSSAGKIKAIFDVKKAVLSRPEYYDTVVDVGLIAAEVNCTPKKGICKGMHVHYSGSQGLVKAAYANGHALIARDGYYNSFPHEDSLAPEVKCDRGICQGDRVYYSNSSGVAEKVFKGIIRFKRSGYYDAYPTSDQVSPAVRCEKNNRICQGDAIFYNGSQAVAAEVYANGIVMVKRSGYYDTYVHSDRLAKRVR